VITMLAGYARAQSTDPADLICPRSAPGSVALIPPDLWSTNGVLQVTFTFQTTVDEQGLTRYRSSQIQHILAVPLIIQ